MPLHRKNDSGELDVFEAARYFSGANENNPRLENVTLSSRAFESRHRPGNKSVSRLSLDMPINMALADTKRSKENNKKSHKQPSSPGGKLIAALVNSIFNQSGHKKKKKSKSSTGENRKTAQISPGEISSRKRRSSMSHFTTSSNDHDSKTNAKTTTKSSYNEFQFRKFPVSRPGNREIPGSAGRPDEKSMFGNRNFGLSERNDSPKATIWGDDDDGESDSSSDLFDLPIISNEINFFSSHMERIRVVV